MAKEAYYFSHDANAHNDPKILSMICDYGMTGYGMFWVVIENLREQDEYKLMQNNNTWKALAMQMQCKPEEVKEFVEKCVYEYALLMNDDTCFYSQSLINRMNKYQDIKEKRSEASRKRWGNQGLEQMQSKCNANAMQKESNCNPKERKGKERKRKENISYTDDFEKFYLQYPNPFNKEQTFKNWLNILKTDKVENIMKALEVYKQELSKKPTSDKQYITRSTNFVGQHQEYKGYLEKYKPKTQTPITPFVPKIRLIDG
jgi:hypothetical protein